MEPAVLLSGMKTFQEKTGVQPYLYLTDEINGSHDPTDEEIDQFANGLYDQLFTDENHFLFLFMEYGDTYISWYVCGSEAGSVMDDAAVDVFLNYVDEYYSSDMEDEEFFSAVFADTAERITE